MSGKRLVKEQNGTAGVSDEVFGAWTGTGGG